MQQIFEQSMDLDWFRQANKYLENLHVVSTTKYGTVTVKRDVDDKVFSDEFDFIVSSIGL